MVRGRGRDGEGMRLPADRGSWVDNACAIQDDAGMPLLQSGVLDRTLETKWSVFVKLRSKGPRAVACVKWFLNAGVCWTSTVATDHLLFSAAFCDRPAQLPRRWPWGLQQHEWVPILPCRLYASRTLLCRVACGRGHVYPTAYCFAGFCQLTAFMQPANIVRRFQEACKIVLYRTSDWIHDCKHPSPPPFHGSVPSQLRWRLGDELPSRHLEQSEPSWDVCWSLQDAEHGRRPLPCSLVQVPGCFLVKPSNGDTLISSSKPPLFLLESGERHFLFEIFFHSWILNTPSIAILT